MRAIVWLVALLGVSAALASSIRGADGDDDYSDFKVVKTPDGKESTSTASVTGSIKEAAAPTPGAADPLSAAQPGDGVQIVDPNALAAAASSEIKKAQESTFAPQPVAVATADNNPAHTGLDESSASGSTDASESSGSSTQVDVPSGGVSVSKGDFTLIEKRDTYFTTDPLPENSPGDKICHERLSGEAMVEEFEGKITISTDGTMDKVIPLERTQASCYQDPDETAVYGKYVRFVINGSSDRIEVSPIGKIHVQIQDLGRNNAPLDLTGSFDLDKWSEGVEAENAKAKQEGGQYNHLVSGWFVVEEPHAMVARFDFQTTDEKFESVGNGKSQTAAMNQKGLYLGEIRVFFEDRDSISARKQLVIAEKARASANLAIENAQEAQHAADVLQTKLDLKRSQLKIKKLREDAVEKEMETAMKLHQKLNQIRGPVVPPPMVDYPPPPGPMPVGDNHITALPPLPNPYEPTEE